jgi:hypothetical protein
VKSTGTPETRDAHGERQPLLMADESSRLSPSVAPSAGRVGDTRDAAPSSSAGSSYELHVLPEKARNIATSETSPDDEHDTSRTSHLDSQQKQAMSRVPLLVRSSPAQGTGKLMAQGDPARFRLDRALTARFRGLSRRPSVWPEVRY